MFKRELDFQKPYSPQDREWHSRPRKVKIWREFIGKIQQPVLVLGLDKFEYNLLPGTFLTGTIGDYNFEWEPMKPYKKNFKTVFCFEVLEHLCNPLLFLQRIKEFIAEDADIYISFPSGRPQFLWSDNHFFEFDPARAEKLFQMAGYRIIVRDKTPILWMKPGKYFKGIRPLLRLIFPMRCRLYHLRLINQGV